MKFLSFFLAIEKENRDGTISHNSALFFFFTAALAILIPTPGRLAFGFVMIIAFNLQIIISILFSRLLVLLKIETLKDVLLLLEIVFTTILFKQLLVLTCPIAALTLGFVLYLSAFSTPLMDILYKTPSTSLKAEFRAKMPNAISFSVVALIFFALRDILGYGTLTYIAHKEVVFVKLPYANNEFSAFTFFATIPGAFLLLALIMAAYLFISEQCIRIKRSRR